MQSSISNFKLWNQGETPLFNTKSGHLSDQLIQGYFNNQHDQYKNNLHYDELSPFDADDIFYQNKNWALNIQKFDLQSCLENALYLKTEVYTGDEEKSNVNTADNSNILHSPDTSHHDNIEILAVPLSNSHYNSSDINQFDTTDYIHQEKKMHSVPKCHNSKKISKKLSKKSNKKAKRNRRTSERLKNIVKNYGKNCASFAIGELGHRYLSESLTLDEISKFREYIKNKIPSITNISNFREMLLVNETDDFETGKFKQTFQHLSEIFVRNYSFNWIFHSPRINDVKGHIFARDKMLRRIQNPKHFTYIH